MQLVRGLKKKESTFVATNASVTKHNSAKGTSPPCIGKVPQEDKDVTSEDLNKGIDHGRTCEKT
ncbi:hypothetical protein KY284_005064 [Solanum tuberosum]|nr:hypothetical protein KY284_005064 [Solanum tuberosum]